MPAIVHATLDAFIRRWETSGAAERANYQLLLSELCDVLEVPRPEPSHADEAQNTYVFEKAVTFQNGDGTTSTGRIDLYRQGCFVLEAKQGLVSILKQLHEELDAAVFAAYGWPATLTDEETLGRLVALNAERAAEERRGLVRWLWPEFQNSQGAGQTALDTGEGEAAPVAAGPAEKLEWPKTMPEQARAVRAALVAQAGVVTAAELARCFKGNASSRVPRLEMLLETLASLGQAREIQEGRFAA